MLRTFSEHLIKTGGLQLNETANSIDASNYNDGDEDGLNGKLYRRPTPANAIPQDEAVDRGMYTCFKLSPDSAKQLYDWCEQRGIPNITPQEKMHSAVVASTVTVHNYTPCTESITLDPETFSLTLLSEALVLKFDNEIHQAQFQHAKNLGAAMQYENNMPHITLSYNPENYNWFVCGIPNFSIVLNYEIVKPFLNEDINIEFETKLVKAKDAVKNWIDAGKGREYMSHLAKLATQKTFGKFHPGNDIVYRGVRADSVKTTAGTSWTKDPKIAKKYADGSGEILKKTITPKTPAIDINKLLGKTLRDKEVFVAAK